MTDRISRRTVLQGGVAAAIATVPTPAWTHLAGYRPAVAGAPIPPDSAFGKRSTAEAVTAGMDLSGKTALVTGCNSGLGFETMRVLALRGALVIGAARTIDKAKKACAEVEGRTIPLAVELTDLRGIVAAADAVAATGVALDMLILNAGIMQLQTLQVVNGVERQFAVNHVGHFLLTMRLLEQVIAADAGRVVVVSSGAHRWAPQGIRFDNLDGAQDYDPREAYGVSKTANGLFSRELARRLAATRATSNSLHPGVIPTNLARHLPERNYDMSNPMFKTIPEGTATQCYVASHPELAGVSGYYFDDCNPAVPNEHMQDDAMAAKLWAVSEELVADYL